MTALGGPIGHPVKATITVRCPDAAKPRKELLNIIFKKMPFGGKLGAGENGYRLVPPVESCQLNRRP